MKKILLTIILMALAVAGCSSGSQSKTVSGMGTDGLLCDFENLKIWGISPERGFKLSFEKKLKTQGEYSLKVVYPREDLASINTKKLFPEWSSFDYLTFDVYNPQSENVSFSIRIDDVAKKRVVMEYPLLPAGNKVKISLKELGTHIDTKNIGFIVLFLNSPNKKITLYFDNMRLIKKENAPKRTGSVNHPRLFFTKNDLPALKERFNKGPYWLKNGLMQFADVSPYWAKGEFLDKKSAVYDIFSLGFVYQFFGDKDYARQAIKNMLNNEIKSEMDLENYAFGFDWCYEEMVNEDRDAIVSKMERAALQMMNKKRHFRSFHNTMYKLTTSIAACGYALEGESDLAKKFITFSEAQFNDALLMFNKLFIDGEWPEGMDYNRHIAVPLVKYFEIVKSATGKDLYKECDWLLKNAYFTIYTTQPDNTFYRFADNDLPVINDWERRFLVRAASYYKDPYIQWYVNHKTEPHSVVFKHIFDVLWYDPYLEEKPPNDLPRAKYFSGLGVVIARSGWKENDTWFSFKCGNYFGDHCHLDNNSFTIYKSGNLAIDSGLYGDDFASSHWSNYYSRTIAHNTISVYDPLEKFYGYERIKLSNDGGQKIMLWENGERAAPENYITPDPSLPLTWTKNSDKWQTGEIKRYRLTDEYCYMAGDATKSYSFAKLTNFTRQILFIFPDYFIVFDRVNSTNQNFTKKWLLHAVNEPKIEDNEITVADGKGKLFCKPLYPIDTIINKVGGKGEEFLVDGKNYTHNGELFPGNIPGNWRIEIKPSVPVKEDIFLNFLYTSDLETATVSRVEKIETDNALGAILNANGMNYLVVFKRSEIYNQVNYSIKKDGAIKNLIFDLVPKSKYEIKSRNSTLKIVETDENGILEFVIENSGGSEIKVSLVK